METQKKLLGVVAILILTLSFLYLSSKGTLTAYESKTKTSATAPLAAWNIELNGTSMSDQYEKTLTLKDISWTGNHVNPSTVAPGSKGSLQIKIDPTTTDVAIRYDFHYQDRTTNPTYLFTVTSVTLNDATLVKTGANSYSGTFTKEELQTGITKTLTIGLSWINDETMNEEDSAIGAEQVTPNAVSLQFMATQYLGEEILPYVE